MTSRNLCSANPPRELEAGAVFELLDRVARRLRQIHSRTMSETGLTPPQYGVLRALWNRDRQAPRELAALAGCTRATMTGLLDSLEKQALIQREAHPTDRRSLQIVLTRKGKALRHEAPGVEQMSSCCCAGLSAHEMSQLAVLLRKLDVTLAASCAGGKACSEGSGSSDAQ